MPRPLSLVALAAIAAAGSSPLKAQQPADSAARRAAAQPQDTSSACPGCPRRRPVFAFAETMMINVLVNRFDAWVANQDWARVGPDDWSRNLRLGWEWDEDEFPNNMFSHPYHGGLYFNAGRSNGLDYWESVPLAFLGSATWEYFAEAYRPSLNDFFMTSFGGIALGETFHRLGASIRDNTRRGGSRTFREIAALPLDPVGSINRLFSGGWSKVGPNPPEHDPGAYVFRLGGGLRIAEDTTVMDTTQSSAAVIADLVYGDRFARPYRAPFDVFSVRAQVSTYNGLNVLRSSGRLYGRNINREAARNRHLFEVNQRYDFVNNRALKFGAQSVEAGVASRWRLGRRTTLRSDLFIDGIVMGALDAPYSGVGERTYDFGPGLGVRLDFAFEKDGITRVAWVSREEWIHSVSGAAADHFVALNALEITVPVYRDMGLGFYLSGYERYSKYPGQPTEHRDYPEVRFMVTWTTSAIALARPNP